MGNKAIIDKAFSPLDFVPDAVVIDNGEYPNHPRSLKWLSDASYVVCCDGAADYFIRGGGRPDMIIGDGDSISKENARRFEMIFHRIGEQETNDQTKAVNYLITRHKNKIVIVGGTGKREDHTLGNISLLIEYMHMGAFVIMATDYGIFIPCRNTVSLRSYKGQQISIFSFGAVHFGSKNLVYPLPVLDAWWKGTLNESMSDHIDISAEGDYLVFMEYERIEKRKDDELK